MADIAARRSRANSGSQRSHSISSSASDRNDAGIVSPSVLEVVRQEYQTRSTVGYENMAWKDSGDSVMYPDGTLVRGPKALCELQGYVFDAWLRMAQIYDELDNKRRANALRAKAAVLFRRDDAGPKALPNIGRHRQYLFLLSIHDPVALPFLVTLGVIWRALFMPAWCLDPTPIDTHPLEIRDFGGGRSRAAAEIIAIIYRQQLARPRRTLRANAKVHRACCVRDRN